MARQSRDIRFYSRYLSFGKGARGFTLIELLVVIAIIGILASVVLASLNTARQKARDVRRISDLNQVKLALELYYDANSYVYPVGTGGYVAALAVLQSGGYIPVLPDDPLGGTNHYRYCRLTTTTYQMAALLEAANPALNNDVDTEQLSCQSGDNLPGTDPWYDVTN